MSVKQQFGYAASALKRIDADQATIARYNNLIRAAQARIIADQAKVKKYIATAREQYTGGPVPVLYGNWRVDAHWNVAQKSSYPWLPEIK